MQKKSVDIAVLAACIAMFAATVALCAKGACKFTAFVSGGVLLSLILHMLKKARQMPAYIDAKWHNPQAPSQGGSAC